MRPSRSRTTRPAIAATSSRLYEDGQPAPWRMQSLPADFSRGMLQAIVGFEIAIDRLGGKFKLSQNRRREDVDRVAAALEAQGQEELARLMRAHADRDRESR